MENLDKEKIERIVKTRKKAIAYFSKKSKVLGIFDKFIDETYEPGNLTVREKRLIAVGIAVTINNESCMEWNIKQALENGATEEEIIEAIEIAVELGGAPATVHGRFAMNVIEYYTQPKIRKITKQDDFVPLAKLLNAAFGTVAKEFGLTKENNPTNSAFITSDELKSQLIENREFYEYEDNNEFVGFIAIEHPIEQPSSTSDLFYIEKVAVIPECRHLGIGKRLMDFATNRIIELGGKRIFVGLINSNIVLKNWYDKQGFVEYSLKTFEHLPFEVSLMEKILN